MVAAVLEASEQWVEENQELGTRHHRQCGDHVVYAVPWTERANDDALTLGSVGSWAMAREPVCIDADGHHEASSVSHPPSVGGIRVLAAR